MYTLIYLEHSEDWRLGMGYDPLTPKRKFMRDPTLLLALNADRTTIRRENRHLGCGYHHVRDAV